MDEILAEAWHVSMDFPVPHGPALNVLADVSCAIAEADRIAVVGPSGSGKSTLLNLLGGLIRPTRGRVAWPSCAPQIPLRPRHIALVFQTPSLIPTLTVLQNVALPLVLAGRDIGSEDRAGRLLEVLRLGDLARKLPEEISGGQAQRAAMARALVTRPRLVLADEPTGQLDGDTARSFLDTVLALLADTPTALVIATHDRTVAARLSQSWKMAHGHLSTSPDDEAAP